MKKPADLRVCGNASCMWIFKRSKNGGKADCPKCDFGSYGAAWAFGRRVYHMHKTQELYFKAKTDNFAIRLRSEIEEEMRNETNGTD
jgi:hypothetical protein